MDTFRAWSVSRTCNRSSVYRLRWHYRHHGRQYCHPRNGTHAVHVTVTGTQYSNLNLKWNSPSSYCGIEISYTQVIYAVQHEKYVQYILLRFLGGLSTNHLKKIGACAEAWPRETTFVVEVQVRYLVFVRVIVSLLTGRRTMLCKQWRCTWHTLSLVHMCHNLNLDLGQLATWKLQCHYFRLVI